MKFTILVDTCFWIALLDNKTPEHTEDAIKISDDIENESIIIPFPTLYEFVNSRLSRRAANVFASILKKPNIILFDDTKYKYDALEAFFQRSNQTYSDVSFVDEVLKLIMDDNTVEIDYLASFDKGLVNYALSKNIKGL